MRQLSAIPALLMTAALGVAHGHDALKADTPVILVGSDQLVGKRVGEYRGTWISYNRNDKGEWVEGATYHEQAVEEDRDGRAVLKHTQSVRALRGPRSESVAVHDRNTLGLIEINQTTENGPADRPIRKNYSFDESGYSVAAHFAEGETRTQQSHWLIPGFYAMNFGLTLSALPLAEGYLARLPSTLPQMNGEYWVLVTVSGSIDYKDESGHTQPAWVVDVDWLNLRDGGLYPGGEKGSGGTYYIAHKVKPGEARVLRYVNESADIRLTGNDQVSSR